MAWPRFRNPIQKLIVPTADLGLGELDFSGLQFPTDVPLVLALQAVQVPGGARIVQGTLSGNSANSATSYGVLQDTVSQAAGSSPTFSPNGWAAVITWVEVKSFTGAPTNIIYTLDISLDGGTTWYKALTLAGITVAGLAHIGIGNVASPAVAGDIKAAGTLNTTMPALARISWTFTGGAAPAVSHKMWQHFR